MGDRLLPQHAAILQLLKGNKTHHRWHGLSWIIDVIITSISVIISYNFHKRTMASCDWELQRLQLAVCWGSSSQPTRNACGSPGSPARLPANRGITFCLFLHTICINMLHLCYYNMLKLEISLVTIVRITLTQSNQMLLQLSCERQCRWREESADQRCPDFHLDRSLMDGWGCQMCVLWSGVCETTSVRQCTISHRVVSPAQCRNGQYQHSTPRNPRTKVRIMAILQPSQTISIASMNFNIGTIQFG